MKAVLISGIVVSAIWGYYWFARGRFIYKAKRILDKDPGITVLNEMVKGEGSIEDLKSWLRLYDEYTRNGNTGELKELLS